MSSGKSKVQNHTNFSQKAKFCSHRKMFEQFLEKE